MSGKKITKQQKRIYMNARNEGCSQLVSAAKAGISERSGRAIDHRSLQPKKGIRGWRTRPDPFAPVWDSELASMLQSAPSLLPITLLEYLQDKYPEQYPDKLLRTMERRVKQWKALYGPEKEVMFRQIHMPGRRSYAKYLASLSEHEVTARYNKRVKRHIKDSKLPPGKTLATFNFKQAKSINKAMVEALADDASWVKKSENLVIFGPSGVGKTHLAAAIGHSMIEQGIRVLFSSTTALVQKLQFARNESSVLFDLIADRYENSSIIVTANQPFSE